MSADDFPLLGLINPLILDATDGFRSSTSGSSASVGGPAGSAGGNGLDPLSVDFLASFLGDTDLRARLCTLLGGIFPPALVPGSAVSLGGSAGPNGGSAGGKGLEPFSVDFLASFLGDPARSARRCTLLGGIFPPALGSCSPVSLGGSVGGSAGGVGLDASSTGLLASFLGETDLRDLLCTFLGGIFPPPVTMALSHQLSRLRRGWGDGVGGSGSDSGSGSATGVGGTEGWSQL